MKPESISLLCAPGTHEPLSLASEPQPDGSVKEFLVGVNSGVRFSIQDGIPLLLDQSKISGFNQQYQGFYNRVAGGYDSVMRLFASIVGGGETNFRNEFLNELEINDGDRVLEVSIGTGTNMRFLPPKASYFGVDLSWGMLKKCQKKLNRWNLAAELIFGNAEDLPLQDDIFNCVFHVGGINAFNDRSKAISEMIRVAKSGTKILIVDETAKLMKSLSWMPTAKKWIQEHGERISAPVELVPEEMCEIQVKEVAKGNMYCLTFRKP